MSNKITVIVIKQLKTRQDNVVTAGAGQSLIASQRPQTNLTKSFTKN